MTDSLPSPRPSLPPAGRDLRSWAVLSLLLLLPLAGCGGDGDGSPERDDPRVTEGIEPDGTLHVEEDRTYEGVLPCASCPGIRTTVQLRPDGTAQLRLLYLNGGDEEGESFLRDGRWAFEPEGRIVLEPSPGEVRWFRPQGDDSLLALDMDGEEIASDYPLVLTLIRHEGSLEAPAAVRADDEGSGLLDREWEFVEAGALPLDEVPSRPHLTLDGGEGTVSGSTGCNRVVGSYRLEGDELTFAPAATTRMACPGPADEVEAGILDILERTRSFRVANEGLELLDGDDGILARLVATS